jgi:drug/metabolite transporter (DMT)-like permease
MQLFALIAVTMCAFAANSVLNRAGVHLYWMDPLGFAGVRLLAGAVMLGLVIRFSQGRRMGLVRITRADIASAGMLLVYIVPFSLAYLTLPSGVGALILFGVVQLTMFVGAALTRVRTGAREWGGMGIALAGLAWLVWPGDGMEVSLAGAGLMALSGLGWGLFSLLGRRSHRPLNDMATSFLILSPVAVGLIALGSSWSFAGIGTAILSGAIMSGLGYALWYRALPRIAVTTGAVAQLSVPVIAIIAGAVWLGEALTAQIVLASVVVLGGIAVSVIKR